MSASRKASSSTGRLLAQIDPRPNQAALDLAQGNFAHDQGLLDQAKSDLQRFIVLGRQDSIAMQQVADQKFLVQQDTGLVQEDQANIETANFNLTYCHIGRRSRGGWTCVCRSRKLRSDAEHDRAAVLARLSRSRSSSSFRRMRSRTFGTK